MPAEYDIDTTSAKFKGIYRQLPASLLGVYSNQRALIDESEIIGTQIGTVSRSENGSNAWDALYDTSP
jgi:hypothetical protein